MTLVNPMQFFSHRFAIAFLVASIFLGGVHAQTFQRVEQAGFGKMRDGTTAFTSTLLRNKRAIDS